MKKIADIFSMPLIISIILMVTVFIKNRMNLGFTAIICIYSVLTLIFILLLILMRKTKFYPAIVIIWIILILFFFRLKNIDDAFKYFNDIIPGNCAIIGEVAGYPEVKNGRNESVIKVLGIKKRDITDYLKSRNEFKILLKIDTQEKLIGRGNIVLVGKKFKKPPEKVKDYSYRDNLFYKNIYGIIYCDAENVRIIDNKIFKSSFTDFTIGSIVRLREKILNILSCELNDKSFSFVQSVFFGIRGEMDKETIRQFSNTGMIHLIAISGFNFGFLGIIIFKIFNMLISKSKSLAISAFFLFAYISAISESASSLRAFYMYLTAAFFFIAGIKSSGISILSVSAIVLCFINPFYVFDLGFKFSFFATAGILLFNGIIRGKLYYKMPDKIKDSISVTLSAFLSVFMLQWAVFDKVPFFSLISSVLVVPVFTFVFILLFFLIIIILFFKIFIIFKAIDIICFLFLKIIYFLDFIPSAGLSDIPEYFSLIFFIFLIVYFYCLDPQVKKLFIYLKIRFFK